MQQLKAMFNVRPVKLLNLLNLKPDSKVDQWCADYEGKIRALGGIGFFMGGLAGKEVRP